MIRLTNSSEAREIIGRHSRILVMTHERPDGDAFGSALGLVQILRDCFCQAVALLPDELPIRYRSFAGDAYCKSITAGELADFDLLISLDCAKLSRIAVGSGITPEDLPADKLLNIDHHAGNDISCAWSWVDGSAAATAVMVCSIAHDWHVSAAAATLLLIGLITDTGAFRFSNTNGEALRTGAFLREKNADWDGVINAVFFSKPRNQQLFEADMLQNYVKTACDGRFLYCAIPNELFARYDFNMRDGEAVIDLLREIDGVVIAALLYEKNGVYKTSLRSKDSRYPAATVAAAFGGGGHLMAAGATLHAESLAAAEKMLYNEVYNFLK